MAKHNRRYKDSVFVDFFGEDKNAKANFLSLYNALHGTCLDETTELEPLRLEQVMYMAFRNDVACLVDGKIIVLVEHQSTINANMPLRFLQYAARLYERIQNPRARYLRRLKKIPTPEFYVFYNGEEDYPETATLRLSDAFMTMPEKSALEVVVSVTNINYNKDNEILHTCKPLKEYTLFVDAVRRHTKLDRCVKLCPMQCVVEGEEVRLCVFIFAEKIDKDRILIPTIVCCHKTSGITAPEMDT